MVGLRYYISSVVLVCAFSTAWGQNSLADVSAVRERLPAEDFRALKEACELERSAADMLLRFYENYDAAAALRAEYEQTSDAALADSIWVRHAGLERANAAIADSLGSTWERIFDSKTFAYNYLLDVGNHRDVLRLMEQAGRDAHDEFARRLDEEHSESVLGYLVFKPLIFHYESTLAGLPEFAVPTDSLAMAVEVFDRLKRRLPPIDLEQRVFIVYEPIEIHSPSRYTSADPIPEAPVYRHGTIYRVRLGNYGARQPVANFKNVHPLCYVRDGERWHYHAGGYADFDGAVAALADMKKRGFSGAVLTLWTDGEAVTLADGSYRVAIETTDGTLPEAVRAAVVATGKDITRTGTGFTVGTFSSGLDAARAASSILRADPSLASCRVVAE